MVKAKTYRLCSTVHQDLVTLLAEELDIQQFKVTLLVAAEVVKKHSDGVTTAVHHYFQSMPMSIYDEHDIVSSLKEACGEIEGGIG